MKLHRMKLENFKGIKSFEFKPGGADCNVYGDNARGKTTLADGFHWCLFGKDSAGRSDFEIKPLQPNGESVHGLESSVEVDLEHNGQRIVLQRVLVEKWVKRRGGVDKEFTGNETHPFVDGVPVGVAKYELRVKELCDIGVFQLLTDPMHFSDRLHWEKRREILLDICGDVTDEEIIASNESLSDLKSILDGRGIEDHRKVIAARRRKINEELERIPVRVDEAERALPDTSQIADEPHLLDELKSLRSKKYNSEQELARIEAGGEIAEKTKELREVEAEIQEAENAAAKNLEDKKKTLRGERDTVADDLSIAKDDLRKAESGIRAADDEITRLTKVMDDTRLEWEKENELKFEELVNEELDICVACGQKLPEVDVEMAHMKALKEFNRTKSEKLTRLSDEGKKAKEQCDSIESGRETRERILGEAQGFVETQEASLESVDKLIALAVPLEADTSELEKKAVELNSIIDELRLGIGDQAAGIRHDILNVENQIQELQQSIDAYATRARGEVRINELKDQERSLAKEFEELERELFLIESFIRAKVTIMEKRINDKFPTVTFKLFHTHVNGSLSEVCEVSSDGVPWRNLNHGCQVNSGLEIINVLSEHYGMTSTIFVDQAESITDILPTKSQQVRLIVSEDDKELRIEAA